MLMRQMLIQKNGSIYVFLTDEEQEINNEIEKENVEMPEVITKIAEMIYEDISPARSISTQASVDGMRSPSIRQWMTAL